MRFLWFTTKWTTLLTAWFLSILITLSSGALMTALSGIGSLLNLPSVHMKQVDKLKETKRHQKKVNKMVKRNADRSAKRVANAMKRMPADEMTNLLGPLGLLAGSGFIAYDLADMCFEINDANELLRLIGEPTKENPISDNCDKVERGTSYVMENIQEGWSLVVTKTQDGWEQIEQVWNEE